jgi:tetratricopeptide (TPR) repeat protein
MRFSAQLLKCALCVALLASSSNAQPPEGYERIVRLTTFIGTLLQAGSQSQRAQLLESNKALVTVELRRHLINSGSNFLLSGGYAMAHQYFMIAEEVSRKIDDKHGLATAWLNIGTVYYFQVSYPDAVEYYKRARNLFLELGIQHEAAKALSGLALIYKDQRNDSEALKAFQEVVTEFTKLGDKEEIGNAWNNIGAIHYSKGNYVAAMEAFEKGHAANGNPENIVRVGDALYMQGDYAQAFTYYKQALGSLPPQNAAGIIAALTGAANSAYYQGNYDEALQFYEKTFLAQQAQRERLGMANSLRGAGNVHRSRGDYGAALENYFKSLELTQQVKAPTGPLLNSIGTTRSLQGNNVLAVEYFQKALTEFETSGNKVDVARTLSLIGNSQYLKGSYDLALEVFVQSLILRQSMNDTPGMASQFSAIGTVFLRQAKYVDALKSYREALGIYESMGSKEGTAMVLTQIADTLLYQQDFPAALENATRAVDLCKQTNSTDTLWYALLLVGKTNSRLGRPDIALKALNESIALVESFRAEPTITTGGERGGKLPYLAAVDLMVSRDKAAEAFDYAERAKVQDLYELLRRNNARSTKGLTPDEISQEKKLIGEAASLQLQIERDAASRNSSEARRTLLRNRLVLAKKTYADLRHKFYTLRPQIKTQRGELAPLKLDELRQLVADRQTALLEYVVTEQKVYLFVTTLDEGARSRTTPAVVLLKAYPLKATLAQVYTAVNQFAGALASKGDNYSDLGRALYDELILPAASQLQNKTRLIVIPDGVLWRLPFEALQRDPQTFLIDDAQISYVPSLSAFREIKKMANPVRRVPGPAVLVGNPILSPEFAKRVELTYGDKKLSGSDDQESEVKQIAALYPAASMRLNTGELASEENVKAQLGQASVIHFSAPALIDDASPMSSFVGLSSGKSEDGFFHTREALNAQTMARLVVMSRAQFRFDDGFSGALAVYWSYFVTGSPTLVANRWEGSPSTTQIMVDFHKQRRATGQPSLTTASALRKSLLTVRRLTGYEHPHFWSGFSLIGDSR